MNKLKGDCFIGRDTSILLYKILVNIQIFALVGGGGGGGKLVFDWSRLQDRIFVYTLVINCTIKLTCSTHFSMQTTLHTMSIQNISGDKNSTCPLVIKSKV